MSRFFSRTLFIDGVEIAARRNVACRTQIAGQVIQRHMFTAVKSIWLAYWKIGLSVLVFVSRWQQ